jgi:hypothetical protein
MSEDHIHFRRIRPRIKVETPLKSEQIIKKIKSELSDEQVLCSGQTTSRFATICPPEKDQHFWSPQLTITIEDTDEGALVRGLYGPRPSVWTMFVFFYSIIGFAAMIVAMIGLSYWSLGQSARILWLVPGLIFLFLSLYLVAYTGQKFGHRQMTNLHRFMEKCLGEEIEAV